MIRNYSLLACFIHFSNMDLQSSQTCTRSRKFVRTHTHIYAHAHTRTYRHEQTCAHKTRHSGGISTHTTHTLALTRAAGSTFGRMGCSCVDAWATAAFLSSDVLLLSVSSMCSSCWWIPMCVIHTDVPLLLPFSPRPFSLFSPITLVYGQDNNATQKWLYFVSVDSPL